MICTKDMEAVMNTFREALSDYACANETASACERETQDILHDLEIVRHSYSEKAKLAARLSELRRERREAKDAAEVLEPLVGWLNDNAKARNELENVLGMMRKRDQYHTNRVYFRREGANAGEIIGGNSNGV